MSDSPPSVAQVVGANAKRLRGEVPGDRLAGAARRRGLNWGTGRIADLEAGRVSPTYPMLVALALALGDIREEPIKLSDLVVHDGFVSVTGDLVLEGGALARYVTDAPVEVLVRDMPTGQDELAEIRRLEAETLESVRIFRGVTEPIVAHVLDGTGEAEDRAARALGVGDDVIAVASAHLWQQSLSDERDERAGRDASAQKRGRITRQLYAELKAVIDGDD